MTMPFVRAYFLLDTLEWKANMETRPPDILLNNFCIYVSKRDNILTITVDIVVW